MLEPVSAGFDVIENVAYHKLLLMYRGEIAPEELLGEPMEGNDRPTILYGVGNWRFYNGEPARAHELFERIVASDPWAWRISQVQPRRATRSPADCTRRKPWRQ